LRKVIGETAIEKVVVMDDVDAAVGCARLPRNQAAILQTIHGHAD